MCAGNWTAPEYLKAKPKIRILVLGSYEDSAKANLVEIKEFLIGEGYIQTRLVADFNNPLRGEAELDADYNLRKSEHWLPQADVAVFVFLPKVNNDGPEYELQHTANCHYDMMWRSIIAWSSNPRPNVSSLFEGLVNRWEKTSQVVFFGTIQKLCEESVGLLTAMLDRLYNIVIKRNDGEWELDS